MPVMRIQVDSDPVEARRVLRLHRAGKVDHQARDAARDLVWRHGRTPAGEPVFVGVTDGRRHVRLLYDVEVHAEID